MAEILKEWLTEILQRPISWQAGEFGDMMKNGLVIASVLLGYRVINEDEHLVIRSGNLLEDVKNNWKYLKGWLERLNINVSKNELELIEDGNGSCILRLFYQLFLQLDTRDRTNFIKRERKMASDLVEKLEHRFKVEKVFEPEPSFVDNLSKPLLNEKHFIEWQRKKAKQVKDTYDYIRHRYSKLIKTIEEKNTPLEILHPTPPKLTTKEKRDIAKFSQKYPCVFQNYTYEQLVALEEKAQEHKASIAPKEWVKQYMDDLQTRLHKKEDSEEFQKQLGASLSGSLWNISIHEEESKLDTELAKKVMKLSQFEKQMCTQIMETKQQARNLIRNRIQAEKEYTEQRISQFNQFLDNVKEEIHLELIEIDFEKKRQDILHKRLYAEKMKRKRQHYYEICFETMESIVDYATKIGHFHKLKVEEIPDHFIHEWKNLYYKMQPIFDILDPMEKLLKEFETEEEKSTEVEEIVRLELDRQEALNEEEFKEYHNYIYPWDLHILLHNYDPDSEESKYEYLGMRILGHVVYTLLDIKYPYPPLRPPADLPEYKAKAILRGLPDRSITVPMQVLLTASKIHVVRLEKAINFCLRSFKTELVGCSDIELSFDKFAAAAQEEEDRELIKLMKTDDDVSYKSGDLAIASMLGVIPANTKQTQTPKTIPEEEIVLSNAAELGKYTYEALSSGDTLTDHLMAAIIVEYLKNQDDINGFVIINYPNTYREAQILEETFLGIAPPDEDNLDDRDEIYLEESIIKHRKIEKDEFKTIRVSKLVNDPHKYRIVKPFESYFTTYITLKSTEDILNEIFIWDLTADNSEFIDRFYAAMGMNYSMYYEVVDKDFLAQICRYIIGDITIPMKSPDLLFGENVLSLIEFTSAEDRKPKTKMIKTEASSFKSVNVLQSKVMSEPAEVPSLEVASELSVEEDLMKTFVLDEKSVVVEEELPIILAGEEDWDYGKIPMSETIALALANCWEEIEKTYIQDISQLFFAKRLQINCLVPYTRFIKDKMEQIITLPSNKQDLVSQFQKSYNDFENDWRHVNLTKNEWHCRVKELQTKLYKICDERKAYATRQRQLLIMDNWAMEELTSMANTYISCMQAELNRSVMTFQTFHDFYYTMIKRMPPADILSPKELIKIYRDTDDGQSSKRSGEDKTYKRLRNDFLELQLHNIKIDYANNPFNYVIENNVKLAMKIIKELNENYRSIISRDYAEIAKVQAAVKKKDNGSEESVNLEEIFKMNALKCVEEWTMGINGEMFRANLRMLALQHKCYSDMELFSDTVYDAFDEIQIDIDNYYSNEIQSVDRLCKYIQLAIENGRRIPENLVLEHDTFVIDPNLLHFTPSEPPADTKEVCDKYNENDFRISELHNLRNQFKIVGPTGIILQQAFIYLLQDFIFFGKESCSGGIFPEVWRKVDPEQIPKFVTLMFGDTVYIDWRDFLILCLNLRIPSIEELLDARHRLRSHDPDSTELIHHDDFMEVELWFESDFDPECKSRVARKNEIKKFLFELFEAEPHLMNYSAFLLAFCKGYDPAEGFSSALSMAVGKRICQSLEQCQEVVNKLIKDKEYKDACLACALSCTNEFLEQMLTNVIEFCEGYTVSEIQYEQPVEDKKVKGGKAKGGKAKPEGTQSARALTKPSNKSQGDVKSQSAGNVKVTYICPPCSEDKEDENVVEKVEEEEIIEVVPDPNLCYAVSQSVIWNVLRICLPWHFVLLPEIDTSPYAIEVSNIFKRLEVDTDNGDIYVCKFLAEPNVCYVLNKVRKFTAVNIVYELEKVIKQGNK